MVRSSDHQTEAFQPPDQDERLVLWRRFPNSPSNTINLDLETTSHDIQSANNINENGNAIETFNG